MGEGAGVKRGETKDLRACLCVCSWTGEKQPPPRDDIRFISSSDSVVNLKCTKESSESIPKKKHTLRRHQIIKKRRW